MAEQSTTQNSDMHSVATTEKPQQPYQYEQTVPINLTLASASKRRNERCRVLFNKDTPPIPFKATIPIRLHYTPPTQLTIPVFSSYHLYREFLPCNPWPDTCPFLQQFRLQTWRLSHSDFLIQTLYTSLRADLHDFNSVRETRDTILDAQDLRISRQDLPAEELLPMAHQRMGFCAAFLQEAKAYLSHSRRRAKQAAEIALQSCEMALDARATYLTASDSTSNFATTSVCDRAHRAKLLRRSQTLTISSAYRNVKHARFFSSRHEEDTTWFEAHISDVEQQSRFFRQEVVALERQVLAERTFGSFDLNELGDWFAEACKC